MGNTGSKSSSYFHHNEANTRQEQLRRILEGATPPMSRPSVHGSRPSVHGSPPSVHGSPPSVHGSPPSVHHGSPPSVHGSPPSVHGQDRDRSVIYYPRGQHMARAHSEHNIQYIDQPQPKHRKGLSKRLSGWLRKLGNSHRSLRPQDSSRPSPGSEFQHPGGSRGQGWPGHPLQPQHRLLSKSDSGLDADSVSLVRSDGTYQDLGTPSSIRRVGSSDLLNEANCGITEFTVGSDGSSWTGERAGSQRRVDQRFKQNKSSPVIPANHWSKFRRRPIYGTCHSEPAQYRGDQTQCHGIRSVHVGHSYPILFDSYTSNEQQRRQYHMSAPGHFRADQNSPSLAHSKYIRQNSGQFKSPPGWAPTPPQSPGGHRSPHQTRSLGGAQMSNPPSPSGSRSYMPQSPLANTVSSGTANGWNIPRSSSQNLLDTVAESEDSLEIYNTTVERQVHSPAFQARSWFMANRSKSASTGCLSQADSGVGPDYAEFEKSIDFGEEGLSLQYQHSNSHPSYERIPGSYSTPKMEVGTQTSNDTPMQHRFGHVCSCKPDIIQYHNCTFIVNPKGLQMGDSAQMHYNSLPKEVRDYMRGRENDIECDSQGVVEVEYSVEEIPTGTMV